MSDSFDVGDFVIQQIRISESVFGGSQTCRNAEVWTRTGKPKIDVHVIPGPAWKRRRRRQEAEMKRIRDLQTEMVWTCPEEGLEEDKEDEEDGGGGFAVRKLLFMKK